MRAKTLIDAVSGKGIFIDDWERVCGLTANKKLTTAERIERVITKAESVGWIVDRLYHSSGQRAWILHQSGEPQPFIAGLSRAGDYVMA